MLALAAVFGAAAGISGAVLSVTQSGLPTGPMIILSLTALVLASLALAPTHGLLWDWTRRRRQRRGLQAPPVAPALTVDAEH
jgi:manganese/zinc/iron transport system permease protein